MLLKGKNVAILGWGVNGLDAVQFLLEKKANITILDEKEKKDLNFSGINSKKVKLILGKDYLQNGLGGFDIIFRAPGVYRYLTHILEAQKKGVIITSVVKLFFDLCPGKIIGVTGTKGKGTTSTLIHEILKGNGNDCYLAGNIGYPVLKLIPKLTKKSWVVLELSSFQLIDLTKSPHIAVVLNITSDHMDWHKDRTEYVNAKTNIVKFQSSKDHAVLNFDYKDSKNFQKYTKAKTYYFSRKKKVKGSYVYNNKIYLNAGLQAFEVGETSDLLLRGEHNWENITAAACASFLAGASVKSIKKTIFNFKGLEHRLELVRNIKGVTFYNDSFSTNPQTTIAAIRSFAEPLTLILGGSDKGLNYNGMAEQIVKSRYVNKVILIGEISEIIKKELMKANFQGKLIEMRAAKIKAIVKKSLEMTPRNGIVLLSPATASFDMFKDYKDRGNKFKEAVKNLH